ncbi:MAG: bifunctional heptose 7-phosphate kinase/heptose 1-phosphate adenyltransferase [Chthonomonadales bacterium]
METYDPRNLITRQRLKQILVQAPGLCIAVLGDYFLDRYLVTDPSLSERSIETGLEARQVVEIRSSPGAAGTVTNNLAALGIGCIEAIGVIGENGEGTELLRGLTATGVRTEYLLRMRDRFTPAYIKPMVREGKVERELERLDIKNRTPLPADAESHVIHALQTLLARRHPRLNGVIIADQVPEEDCGVVTKRVRQALARLAGTYPETILYADSRARIGQFQNVIIKPNQSEAAAALGMERISSLEEAHHAGRMLVEKVGRTVFLTLGADGILVCDAESCTHVSGIPAEGPIDIVGAGDSATAGIVTALCAGASPVEAAALGCLCARITITKLGTTGTASPQELEGLLE